MSETRLDALMRSHAQLPTELRLPEELRRAADHGFTAALRTTLERPDNAQISIASYITRRNGLRAAGVTPEILSRRSTRVLLFPPDGATREDAEWLAQKGANIRQVRASSTGGRLLHQKLVLVRSPSWGLLAFFGSANLTNGGLTAGGNLELGTVLRLREDEVSSVERVFDGLWDLSSKVEPLDYVARPWHPYSVNFLDFQADAYRQMCEAYEKHRSVALVLPTGAGKTAIAMRYVLQQVITSSSARVLWVAPAHELLEQAYTAFVREQPLGAMTHVETSLPNELGGRSKRTPGTDMLEFWTIHGLHKRSAGHQQVDLLVLDEAHWGLAEDAKMLPRIWERFGGKRVLGLTATPFRGQAAEVEHFGRRFTRIVPEPPIDPERRRLVNSVNEPVFAEIRCVQVTTGVKVDVSELGGRRGSLKWRLKLEEKLNEKIARSRSRHEQVVREWQKNKWKCLIFAAGIEHADALGRAFRAAAPSTRLQVVHSKEIPRINNVVEPTREDRRLTRAERMRIRTAVADGEVDCVIAVDMYNQGVDFPAVKALFLTRPTLSPVLYAQMIGRGRRGVAFGGTKTCHVVDFCDQVKSHGVVIDALMNYVHYQRGEGPSWGPFTSGARSRQGVTAAKPPQRVKQTPREWPFAARRKHGSLTRARLESLEAEASLEGVPCQVRIFKKGEGVEKRFEFLPDSHRIAATTDALGWLRGRLKALRLRGHRFVLTPA